MSDLQEKFATIRTILQKPGTPETWKELCAHLGYIGSDKVFKSEYMPYVNSVLDTWDDEVRQTTLNTESFLLPLGRVLLVEGRDATKKEVKEALTSSRLKVLKKYKGASFQSLNKHALFLVQTYCEAIGPDVESLHLHLSPPLWGGGTKYELSLDGVRELLGWVFERYQGSLKHLGLDYDNHSTKGDYLEAMWGTLMEWAPKLTSIESLSIGQGKTASYEVRTPLDQIDWGRRVLASEHFAGLTSLAECDMFYRLPHDAITEREASKNLRRLRLHSIDKETGLSLLQEPNLANIQVWELIPGFPYEHYGWGSKFAEQWNYELAKQGSGQESLRHPLLGEVEPKINDLGTDELFDIFVDPQGNLVPSDMIEGFNFQDTGLNDEFLFLLFREGAKAYPNLKRVSIHIYKLGSYDIRRIAESPLISQLEKISFYHSFMKGYFSIRHQRAKLREQCERWLALARDESIDTRLRLHAWICFAETGPDAVKDYKVRAELLGLEKYKSLKADELKQLVRHAIPQEIKPEPYC